MILLTEIAEIEGYYRLRALLEMKGIVLHVGNENTARNFGVFHPVGRYAIHILFEEQYEDARALLFDENHQVQKPMQVNQFKQLQESNQQHLLWSLLKFLVFVLVAMLAGVSLMVFFLR